MGQPLWLKSASVGHSVSQEEEGREMRIIKDPGEPTEREIEEHELTHVPFRAWCKACVRGKAQNDPHYHKQDAERESSKVPVISWTMPLWDKKAKKDSQRSSW